LKLTKEQEAIINSTGDIKINAVAGSGKTTTIIEYAKTRPPQSKILYLAFNKSVKLEAQRKFTEKGLDNVKVETAHSLAYKYIVFKHDYKVRAQGYKTHEIADLLNLKGNEEKHTEYIIANHINKFIAYFCNSDKQKVQDLNYLDTITDTKAKAFVTTFYEYIVSQSRILLGKMDKGDIEITHDFYLKKFQLSNPQLPYDFILFDEGQDASPAILELFLKQKATKVIVGDTHQQIYAWRYAVNSLEKTDFKTYHLSSSFRFNQNIADLALEVLKYKSHLQIPNQSTAKTTENTIQIHGKGSSKKIDTKAILARTNLGLLLKAIEFVTENKKVKKIYFEGNINSYTYAEDGASLYDVLSLYNNKRHLIKDNLIKSMANLEELEDYIDKTEDVQLSMMLEIIKEYGNEIPQIIKAIKDKHVPNDQKEKAEMVFSTIHRCKGMEYDAVELVNDFMTEDKLIKLLKDKNGEEINYTKLNEEINLFYVAVTRSKNRLRIPESLMPIDFPEHSQIEVLEVKEEEDEAFHMAFEEMSRGSVKEAKAAKKPEKGTGFKEIRTKHKDAYQPWTTELDNKLIELFCNGINIKEMALYFGRTKGAIASRLRKLEIEELYG
jgi:F-box protein, helicase, 18